MAKVSGIEIYKHLPRTNCGDCGVPTCMAFAMQVSSKKKALDECPHVSDEARAALGDAQLPPMATVSIGAGEDRLTLGGETVMHRHEERFQHPPVLAIRIDASLDEQAIDARIAAIEALRFERVGKTIGIDAVAVSDAGGDGAAFRNAVLQVADRTAMPLILLCNAPDRLTPVVAPIAERRPLLVAATEGNAEAMASLAVAHSLPLVVRAPGIERTAALAERIAQAGVNELLLDPQGADLSTTLTTSIQLRRLALEQHVRAAGYPIYIDVGRQRDADNHSEAQTAFQMAAAISGVLRYAGVLVLDTVEPWAIHPIVTVRQDIYTDPQVPNAVEAKLYEIGNPGPNAPVLVTTNFALTYFTVAGEVESSKVPAFISVIDTEGLGVLNAYADDRLTAERIVEVVREQGAMDRVRHNRLIIPGLIARLRMAIEEVSGWDVVVGPEDAGGIPRFLNELQARSEAAE